MKFSIVYKLVLSSVLLVLISAGVVGSLFYSKSTELLVDNALKNIAAGVQETGYMLQQIINTQDADVLFLANTPPIQGMLRAKIAGGHDSHDNATYEQWDARLKLIFKSQLQRKSSYLTIRFIDKNGRELVHVGRQGQEIISLSREKLQNKAGRTYVTEALKLPNGSVYVSEINLNREYGAIIEPHQEVLRSATPVYDEKTGDLAGVVAITSEIGAQLDVIQKRVLHTSSNEIFITNDHGGYLMHPDKSKIYGFDLGKHYRIQEEVPQLSNLFLPSNQKVHRVLMPKDTDGEKVMNFTKIPFDSSHPERFIAVVISQDYGSIVAEQSSVLNEVLIWALFLAFAGMGLGILFSFRLTRPITKITQVMDDYTNQRRATVTMPVERNDEIGLLARSYESLIHQVEDAQAKLGNMNRNLENIVSERTHALGISEMRQRSIVENMVDGLVTIDENGAVISFNPAAEKLFGYQKDEVIGKNISMLMAEPYQSEYDHYFQKDHQADDEKIIGIERELEGLRKNSISFSMELSLSEISLDSHKLYTGLVRDITERKQMEKMKNEFISTVSHELRTPLTSIRGSLGLLSGGAVGELPVQATEMLKIASNNTERLLLLINDILDIQKIESGQIAFKFQSLNVMPFIEQALADNATYAEQYGVKFVIAQELADARIYADKDRMMQVMANLLSNAAKFSPENETVEVSIAHHHGASVRISVTDHGSGIPEEFQSKLFDRFTQSDSSDTRQKGGTGLGLSITKTIVEKHGGHINFVSREGIGSTFFIELPELLGEVQEFDGDMLNPLPQQGHLACILIVEDDPDIAALIKRMLAESGYNSDIAYDANEARQRLRENAGQYKAITLDLALPGEDGISFLESLRREASTHDIPVVVVSVKADEAKRGLKGTAVGVIDWLQKPIDQNRLIESVKQAATHGQLPRVLHVEDDADVHQVVSAMVRDHCELTWTTTLAASKEAVASDSFDLVLLDIGLPDGSGLDLLETIEQQAVPPRVVIFSANDVTEEHANKVNAVLVKSKTDQFRLAEVINRVINQGKYQ
ncbi:MAG: response regulator [Gammaproteobacteria bacterium]|nr:response regulator [Gammaproteobacteria bacterium]